MTKLTALRREAEKAMNMSSDDFGHNCQALLEAESQELHKQCDVVLKLITALEKAIEQRDALGCMECDVYDSRTAMNAELSKILEAP